MVKSSPLSPIDDLTYDVITVLRNKAQALVAYDKYIGDAQAEEDGELEELFLQMRRHDEENVLALKEVLAHRLDEDLGYEDDLSDDEEGDVDEYEEDDVEPPQEVDEAQPSVDPTSRRGESNERQR